MHNTVEIDGENQEQMPEKLLWDYKRKTVPRLNHWVSNEHHDTIESEHVGYNWLGDQILHKRKMRFDKEEEKWTITDCVKAEKKHQIKAFFHLDQEVKPIIDGSLITLFSSGVTLLMNIESADSLSVDVVEMPISKGYGLKENAKVIVVSVNNISNSTKLITKLWVKKD